MRQKAKVDENQRVIVQALRDMGWLVRPMHQVGSGFPDLLLAKAGRVVLMEVKNPRQDKNKRRLKPDQVTTHAEFKAFGVDILIVESIADLSQLDRDARQRFEGGPVREFYQE